MALALTSRRGRRRLHARRALHHGSGHRIRTHGELRRREPRLHARLFDAAQIRELMGTVPNAVFERMFEAVDRNRSAEVMTVANQLLDAGNSPAQLARQCVRYLRNALIAKVAGLTTEGESADGIGNELLQNLPRRAAPRRPHSRPLRRRRPHSLPANHAPHLRRTRRLPPGTALPLRTRPAQTRPPPPPPPHRRSPQPGHSRRQRPYLRLSPPNRVLHPPQDRVPHP